MTGLTFMNPVQVLAACPTGAPAGKVPVQNGDVCTFKGDPTPGNILIPDCGFSGPYKRSTVPGVAPLTCTASADAEDGLVDPDDEEEKNALDECPIKKEDGSWLLCMAFTGIIKTTSIFDNFINTYMTTGNTIFEGESKDQYKSAWETFRNFGIILLIIAGLIMLMSEALGLAIVDAYTVRKVLPRLLIAIIGISISWEFCRFVMGFFDGLGQAMGSIIYTSFGLEAKGIDIASVIGAYMFAGGAATGVALLLGGMGLISLLGTLMLALLIAVIVLIVRQTVLTALVLLAPIAIAAYVLPNTAKYANLWGNSLLSLLLLFPAATGMIALCKVLGNITMGDPTRVANTPGVWTLGEGVTGLIALVTGVGIFIVGYGTLPFLAQRLGGAAAFLSNISNDRTRGGFDRLKNFRKGQTEKNISAMGRGERFKGKYGTNKFNNFTKGATTFAQSRNKGAFLTNKTARSTALSERDELLRQEHMKSAAGMGNMFNDESLKAQAAGATENEARENLKNIFKYDQPKIDNAINMAKANGGFSAVRQRSAAVQAAATGTTYDDVSQMSQIIAAAAHGNDGAKEAMVGAIRAGGAGGRYDLVGMGHSTLSNLVGESMKSGGQAAPDALNVESALVEASRSVNASRLLSGKAKGTSHIANALSNRAVRMQNVADRAAKVGDTDTETAALEEVGEVTSTIANLKGAAPFATEVNLSAMNINRTTIARDAKGQPSKPTNEGNIGFEDLGVARVVTQTQNAQAPIIMEQRDGQAIKVSNPDYRPKSPEARAYSRNSQDRTGGMGMGPFDPRREE